jgi:antirestriction protein ArdC
VLKEDHKALFQIASQASKAADWLLKPNEMAEAAE